MKGGLWNMTIGAHPVSEGVSFRVWAPTSSTVEVVLYGPYAERVEPLAAEGNGYFAGVVEGAGPGSRYRYRLDGGETYPDPASRRQPEGVHGPSEVVDPSAFAWSDQGWSGVDMERLVIYEMHVGTFTPEGTFDAAAQRLPALADLGVTAVQLMPVADFEGSRNWGYDGVDLFAPSMSYGGADGLRRFVDAAHRLGLAVILDVVYNHFGPEGNYIPAITGGRFFTDRHKTPWGDAINYDGPGCEAVRDFVLQNALHWLVEYHVDGLRLDATHAIVDDSPVHILAEIARRVRELPAPRRFLIAEDERNDARVLREPGAGGWGLDGVWADDLHHQLRRLTAGDRDGYFVHYEGSTDAIATTLRHGWWRGDRESAAAAAQLPPRAVVHCIQNHDQVGNRAFGGRLNHEVPVGVFRALSALLLLSPYTPLIWMGQEWAASSPFLYFTDHPEALGKLVTQGRREEFKRFEAFQDPSLREQIPDPQDPSTFESSKLRWEEREAPPHAGVLGLYRELLRLRREHPALARDSRDSFQVAAAGEGALVLRRRGPSAGELLAVINLLGETRLELDALDLTRPPAGSIWSPLLITEEPRFGGDGGWGRMEADGVLHLMVPGAVVLGAG